MVLPGGEKCSVIVFVNRIVPSQLNLTIPSPPLVRAWKILDSNSACVHTLTVVTAPAKRGALATKPESNRIIQRATGCL